MPLKLHSEKYHSVQRYSAINSYYRKAMLERFGKRYAEYRSNWQLASKGKLITRYPLQIDFDTIDQCNLNCIHCQEIYTRKRTNLELSRQVIDSVLRESGDNDLCAINVGAIGEPLLRKDILFYILELSDKYKVMDQYLHTNGILLDKAVSKEILGTNLTHLCISVDAAESDSYRKIRGGDLELLKSNIRDFLEMRKRLKKKFPVLRLSFLVQKDNQEEKNDFLDSWSELADIVDFQPLINYHYFVKKSMRLMTNRCFTPFLRLMVGHQGELTACCCGIGFNKDLILGYYPKVLIYDAWNSEKANAIRSAMLSSDFDNIPTCFDCLARRG